MRGSAYGFTMIELLVVVAVIAILAAIGVPNFLESQVRSKLGRVHQDMAALRTSLSAYYADHRDYPQMSEELAALIVSRIGAEPRHDGGSAAGHWSELKNRHPAEGTAWIEDRRALNVLTTPVAYLGGVLPLDPFVSQGRLHFGYVNFEQLGRRSDLPGRLPHDWSYLLMSYGPSVGELSLFSHSVTDIASGPYLEYDPTNGTTSEGNIFVFGR